MNEAFDPARGPILLRGQISGPEGRANIRLLFDTGATRTSVDERILAGIGLDPAASPDRVRVVTGGGVIDSTRVILTRLSALGQHRFGFPVMAHQLPTEADVDGLLGLDFFRGLSVTLDFRAGVITIA